MKRALFLDLDHTLIQPREGRTFPQDEHDWVFVPGMMEAITPYLNRGDMIIIISNQGGIEAGHQTEAEVQRKIDRVLRDMLWNIKFHDYELYLPQTALYYCPTNDKASPDRKPNPGMILKAQAQHKLDLAGSLFVGDMKTDEEAAAAAGVPYRHVVDFLLPNSGEVEVARPLVSLKPGEDRAVHGIIGTISCINVARPSEPEKIRYFGRGKGCSGQAHETEAQAEQDVQDWHNGKHVDYLKHAIVPLPKSVGAPIGRTIGSIYGTPEGGNFVIGDSNTWPQAWQAMLAGHRVKLSDWHERYSWLLNGTTREINIVEGNDPSKWATNGHRDFVCGPFLLATDWVVLPIIHPDPITV